MPSERNLVIASAGVKPSPPATTRSAPASTTFSVSTEEKVATSGRAAASAGKSLPSSVATIRSPAPRSNRISVVAGVSETIFCGAAASVTAVPSSSVSVTG